MCVKKLLLNEISQRVGSGVTERPGALRHIDTQGLLWALHPVPWHKYHSTEY